MARIKYDIGQFWEMKDDFETSRSNFKNSSRSYFNNVWPWNAALISKETDSEKIILIWIKLFRVATILLAKFKTV